MANTAEGRLEIFYQGVWGRICGNDFGNASARVACSSLGCGLVKRCDNEVVKITR